MSEVTLTERDAYLEKRGKYIPLMFFLNTTGYYLIMMFFFKLGLSSMSRLYTVPMRMLPFLFGMYIIAKYNLQISNNKYLKFLFVFFGCVYLSRIVYDVVYDDFLFMFGSASLENYLLYTLTSFVIPPFLFSLETTPAIWNKSKNWILLSSVAISVIAFFMYRDSFDSGSGRLKGFEVDEESTLSPLAVSYVSALPFAYYLFELLKKTTFKQKIQYLLIMGACIPGLLMGSSRGSILAIVVAVSVLAILKNMLTKLGVTILVIIVLLPFAISIASSYGSALFDRLGSTFNKVDSGDYLEIDRLFLWDNAMNNFYSSPIIGDLIENRGIGHHPHNIIVEAFMATGIVGGIPFVLILLKLFQMLFVVARKTNEYDWVLILFILCFMQHMVSGAIWGGIWLWTSSGAIISAYYTLKSPYESSDHTAIVAEV